MRNILCIDLGTTMGFAGQIDGKTIGGSVCFKPKKHELDDDKYSHFLKWFNTNFKDIQISHLFFELVMMHNGVLAAQTYGGYKAVLAIWAKDNGVIPVPVPVGTIKKHITGKGNAKKDEVILAISKKGFKPIDDNHADALAILDYALTTLKH